VDGTPLVFDEVESEPATIALSVSSPMEDVTTGKLRTTPSIAVLPFINMSADPENEYFCDGLSEELLNALAMIESLKVAAR
jgi:TolB-like protein